ncbi:MAG: uracil-DNA glycosylase family protein [Marinoscillum sp.]
MDTLLQQIKDCRICHDQLELGANPVMAAHPESKIAIVGQAPGTRVHKTGIPWNDPSGKNLRKWMEISEADFYNPEKIAIIPMGFCYPGKGKSGDLPPRKECAPEWHTQLFTHLTKVQLILLVGQYAQNYYLKEQCKATLTKTVRHFKEYLPSYLPLPHPSPRNNIWLKKNSWFEAEVLPTLKQKVGEMIS